MENTSSSATSEARTSKVLKCEFKKQWTGRTGTNYDYVLEMENGDSGRYTSFGKTNELIGNEITYKVVNDGQWGNKIYLVTEKKSGGAGKPRNDRSISAQSAMKAAVELCSHGKIDLGDLEKYAEKIFVWQNTNGNII